MYLSSYPGEPILINSMSIKEMMRSDLHVLIFSRHILYKNDFSLTCTLVYDVTVILHWPRRLKSSFGYFIFWIAIAHFFTTHYVEKLLKINQILRIFLCNHKTQIICVSEFSYRCHQTKFHQIFYFRLIPERSW